MNSFVQYDSSTDEDNPKVKIIVPNIKLDEYKRTIKESSGEQSLLGILSHSKPKETRQMRIPNPKPKEPVKRSREEVIEKEEIEEDFFGLSGTTGQIHHGPIVGPTRPTFIDKQKVSLLVEPNVQQQEQQEQQEQDLNHVMEMVGHKSKHGKIQFTTINARDQLGDVHEIHTRKQISLDPSLLVDARFSKLDQDYIPDKFSRSNNILALAQQAKLQSAEFNARKAERKAVQKQVRAKYGF